MTYVHGLASAPSRESALQVVERALDAIRCDSGGLVHIVHLARRSHAMLPALFGPSTRTRSAVACLARYGAPP